MSTDLTLLIEKLQKIDIELKETQDTLTSNLSSKGVSITSNENTISSLCDKVKEISALKGASNKLKWKDSLSNTWIKCADMPYTTDYYAMANVGDKIHVIGGESNSKKVATNYCYDSQTNTWTTKNNMPTARSYCSAVSIDNLIYCLGGLVSSSTNVNQCYDANTDTWTTLKTMTTSKYAFDSTVHNGVRIYTAGGCDSNGDSLTCHSYDIASNTWTTEKSMTYKRNHGSLATLNNYIYAAGGYGHSTSSSAFEKYDTQTKKWTTLNELPVEMRGGVLITINDKMHLMGGYNTDVQETQKHFIYNENNDSFTPLLGVPHSSIWSKSCVINDKIYFMSDNHLSFYIQ